MADRISQHRRETEDHNERPPDEAEVAGRPLERKERDEPDPGPVHEPGAGEPRAAESDRDPHHQLNNPVGEPDDTADSDPYGE